MKLKFFMQTYSIGIIMSIHQCYVHVPLLAIPLSCLHTPLSCPYTIIMSLHHYSVFSLDHLLYIYIYILCLYCTLCMVSGHLDNH